MCVPSDLGHPRRTLGPMYGVVTINIRLNDSDRLPASEDPNVKPFRDNVVRDGVALGGIDRGMGVWTWDAYKNEVTSSR